MEGTIPVEVVGLTYLESFGITKNPGVKGTIPTEFAGIEPLERLLFRDCSMTGQIPEQFNGSKCQLSSNRHCNVSLTMPVTEFNLWVTS